MFFYSPLEQFDAVLIYKLKFFNYDISLLNLHWSLMVFVFFLLGFYFFYSSQLKLIPTYFQLTIEFIYNLILGLIYQQVGKNGYIYFPFIFTLFNLVLFLNLLSLTPYSMAFTSHIVVIFFISFTLTFTTFLIGLNNYGVSFLKIFIPECPFLLLFLLIPIEIFSYFIRAFSLALRLSANIMAGHTLVFIICGFLLNLSSLRLWISLVFGLLLFLILGLEFGVALLQAYVLTILFCIYLSDSVNIKSH